MIMSETNIFGIRCITRIICTEPAISTTHCPRLYGIFPDENKCDVFWNCWNGEASRYQCSPGLAYDREARVCMWADQVPECRNEGISIVVMLIRSKDIQLIYYRSGEWIQLPSTR